MKTRPRARRSAARRGFTLIELLIVMVIIAILCAMTYGALFQAQATAREARTKALIAKLHGQMMARWESYRIRRVPIAIAPGTAPRVAAATRLQALRDIQRMELPDKIVDVSSPPLFAIPQPALQRTYQQKATAGWTPAWESAECLYLILTTAAGEEGLSAYELTNTEVGDFDGDGMKEFHDGWGRPISFIRWPVGFISDLQPADGDPSSTYSGKRNPNKDHDTLDPLRVDGPPSAPSRPMAGFSIVPLIFSAGPDGLTDIDQPNVGGSDPYYDGSTPRTTGQPVDIDGDGPNFFDNIHNHNVGTRQ